MRNTGRKIILLITILALVSPGCSPLLNAKNSNSQVAYSKTTISENTTLQPQEIKKDNPAKEDNNEENESINVNANNETVLNGNIALNNLEPDKKSEYTYNGELPPYMKDAPWLPGFSRPHIDYVPEALQKSLFFNSGSTFNEFVTKYKGTLKQWIEEAKNKKIANKDDIEKFITLKLNDCYKTNIKYLSSLYPGLTEKQYRLLMIMNLVHGNYEFGTQTKSTGNLMELIELNIGDCSEIADLVSSLAYLQNIQGEFLGLGWDYQSSLGQFISGHKVFYAEGLWVDSEVNIAFKLNIKDILNVEPSKRLATLINNKCVLGFYNWYINPEIRAEQLKNNQDGGTIAFYYYYYFEGIDQGNSNIIPYFPKVVINDTSSKTLNLEKNPIPMINVKNNSNFDFQLLNNQSAKEVWEKELIKDLQNTNANQNYSSIITEATLLNSMACLINYYNQNEDTNKIKMLADMSYEKFDQLLSAKGVFDGKIKGWGRSDRFDAFQDGTINPEYTKYGYQTFFASDSILSVIDAIMNCKDIPEEYKNKSKKYVSQINNILYSWEPVFNSIGNDKGYYGYSEYKCDNKPVLNVSGLAISTFIKSHKLSGDSYSLDKIKKLTNFLTDYIRIDTNTGAYIWPYDLQSQRIDDVRHAMLTSQGILEAVKAGFIDNFEVWRMELSMDSFWSNDPANPNIYISSANSRAKIDSASLSAGIDMARFYEFSGTPEYMWQYAKSILNTNLQQFNKASAGDRALTLELLGLLFAGQPKQDYNFSKISFTSNGGVVNSGDGVLALDTLQTKGNAKVDSTGTLKGEPYFEIFQGDKIVFNIPFVAKSGNEAIVNITYRSWYNSNLIFTDEFGWEYRQIIPSSKNSSEDPDWISNTIKVKLPNKNSKLQIQISGPIDIDNIEIEMYNDTSKK